MSATPNIPPGLINYVFVWHALSDACEKCRYLNGMEWRDQDIFQNTLWDMFWADIWDLNADHTLAHPNCRCQLEVRVEINWDAWRVLQDSQKQVTALQTEISDQIPEV